MSYLMKHLYIYIYIYIYIWSSLSSCGASTYFPDLLSPSIPIILRSWWESIEKCHLSLSLLHQQCLTCPVCLTWMVLEIGGKWLYSWCFVGCFQDLFIIACSILMKFPSIFFSLVLLASMWCIHTVVLTQLLLGRIYK